MNDTFPDGIPVDKLLRDAGDKCCRLEVELRAARKWRDELIVMATGADLSRRRTARLAGVTPGWVQQVLKKRLGEAPSRNR